MKWHNYKWVEISREDLIYILSGKEKKRASKTGPISPSERRKTVLAGFDRSSFIDESKHPSAIIVDDDDSEDLFSWLYSFASDFMPLAMHCQVILASDFNITSKPRIGNPIRSSKLWASVTIGEFLMRGQSSQVLKDFFVSWIDSSCSYSYFSMLKNFDGAALREKFLARLGKIKNDSKLAFPSLDLDILDIVWSTCSDLDQELAQAADLAPNIAVWTILELISEKIGTKSTDLIAHLLHNPNFGSDSVERRLAAFDSVVLSCRSDERLGKIECGFCVGAAAFLVGRSTSHIKLMDGLPQGLESAFLWFSVIAGLCNRASWDPRWFELSVRAESWLNTKHIDSKISVFDLSWPEFDWLSSSRRSSSAFREMVKTYPNSIVFEILPDVHFQVRITKEVASIKSSGDTRINDPTSRQLLDQIEQIIIKWKSLSIDGGISNEHNQRELPLHIEKKKGRRKNNG